MIGLNHKTAPVEIRETFALSEQQLPEAVQRLRETKSVFETVVLSTCNRTELYAVVDHVHRGRDHIKRYLFHSFGIEQKVTEPHVYVKENDQVVTHLFRVICGLDSMVLGETQILGQVKDAFFTARDHEATGTIFNTLFQQAITFAKRVHSETDIGQNAVSVSYAAIELGKKIFGRFDQKDVCLLGAGKMSELTATHLCSNGVRNVRVANRTYERADELASRFEGTAYLLNEMEEALVHSDIVVSSTGASDYVLDKPQVAAVMKKRQNRPLFVIDIAVPRDLDPKINELNNVYLYDIDDLQGIVQTNLSEREKEADMILEQIHDELVAFQTWLNTLGVVPLISSLRNKSMAIQEQTMESIEKKLPDLSERERKVLRKHTKSIVNQMLKDPILRMKEMAAESGGEEYLSAFERIFALEDEMEEAGETERTAQENKKRKYKPNKFPVRS